MGRGCGQYSPYWLLPGDVEPFQPDLSFLSLIYRHALVKAEKCRPQGALPLDLFLPNFSISVTDFPISTYAHVDQPSVNTY